MLADWAVAALPAPHTGWAINLFAPGVVSLAEGGTVIKDPAPLHALKGTYDHSCS
jgi:hypothetical protein